jgi:hypothetical protein
MVINLVSQLNFLPMKWLRGPSLENGRVLLRSVCMLRYSALQQIPSSVFAGEYLINGEMRSRT